ncbi:MAG: MmgE/PrpD family protein [Armatimonadetes bacterium]|nr:MmgE/PrpD family protein [Armatimonadota bacterium]
MNLSQEVSRFVVGRQFEDLPEKAVSKAKQHIMDTLGVLIAAVKDPVVDVIKKYLEEVGGDSRCTVMGTSIKTSLSNAALVNGILAHALDYDDSSWRLIGHPSAAVLPAVFAVGETRHSSGKDVITAYLLGTEVSCKLGLAAEPQLYEAGWHATGVVGVLGATAASGYLLRLTEEQLTNALGIAASLAGGLRQNIGSMTKPFHAGAAAQHGVTAALLARHGFTSSVASLDGKWGFFRNFTCGEREGRFPSPGDPFDILEPGFFIKPYPSCAATHTAIDAMLSLVEEHGFTDEQVARIEVGSGPAGPLMLFHNQPRRGSEGKFSMPFVLAMAVIERKVGLETFLDSKVNEPRVLNLIEKTRFYVAPEFANISIDEAPAIVKVSLKDGRELVKQLKEPLGSPLNPMSQAQLIEKYKDCTYGVLAAGKVERSLAMLAELDALENIELLINELVP